ncbi:MHO_1580 family protein [Mesomycoplasma neurolyticum]|uniref:Uncharacterized protein n=1 Tax=Mesomycoplasma neurolyticum TaxID=2120 RepID=A0A449A6G3_9BACT|nr:hypothetical protein [Mesomycoplasma neurolyticum]VEU59809.1 Uncharacterised protein [Mesomycoplasma neurolyticum]
MVNVPIVEKQNIESNVITKNISFFKEVILTSEKNNHKIFIEIKRYIKDDAFSVKVTHFSKYPKFIKINLFVNDQIIDLQTTQKLKYDDFAIFYFPFTNIKQKFSEIKTIKVISYSVILNGENEEEKNEPLITMNLTKNENLNKTNEFSINKEINFKTLKVIRMQSIVDELEYYNNDYDKEFYNNVFLFPRSLKQGIHNEVLFDVAVTNDIFQNEIFERDFLLDGLELQNLPIENDEILKLSFSKNSDLEPKWILGKKIIGQIKIIDQTYFDIEKQKTVKGINSYSKPGFLIPHNFEGLITLKSKLFINHEHNIVFVNFSQKIHKPFLHKNNGIVKLLLSSYREKEINELDHFLIKNNNFKYVFDENIDINGLKNLYIKKEDEEDEITEKN